MKRSEKTEGDEPKRSKDDEPIALRTMSSAQSQNLPGTSIRIVNTYRGAIKMPTRRGNPFLQVPVIRSLLKQVEKASEVKIVRGLNQDWDLIGVQELEKRAIMGKLAKVNFIWSSKTTEEAEKGLSEFLKDTQINPNLFRGFAFNFPNALAPFHSVNNGAFLRQYLPHFIMVALPCDVNLEKDNEKGLFLDFLRWTSQNLRELTFSRTMPITSNFLRGTHAKHTLGRLPVPSEQWDEPLDFLNLEKIKFKQVQPLDELNIDDFQDFYKGFEFVVLGSGKIRRNSTPKLKSLILNNIKSKSLEELLGICPEYPDISRWINLTQINFKSGVGDLGTVNKIISCLLSLARNGMALTSFRLDLILRIESDTVSELTRICIAFTLFFAMQAKSMKNLDFKIRFSSNIDVELHHKIKFPVFESLTHLSLGISNIHGLRLMNDLNLIEWRGWAESFPQLKHLTLNGGDEIDAILYRKVDSGEEQLSLEHLEVASHHWNEPGIELDFGNLIQSVEIFKCCFEFLTKCGEEIPWVDALQKLTIKDVRGTLKLGHLNGLKELIVEDRRKIKEENFKRFLTYFDGVASLNLKYIKFRINKLEEIIKREFEKKFPFPVEFEETMEGCSCCNESTPI